MRFLDERDRRGVPSQEVLQGSAQRQEPPGRREHEGREWHLVEGGPKGVDLGGELPPFFGESHAVAEERQRKGAQLALAVGQGVVGLECLGLDPALGHSGQEASDAFQSHGAKSSRSYKRDAVFLSRSQSHVIAESPILGPMISCSNAAESKEPRYMARPTPVHEKVDLLDLLASGSPAAFATDAQDRIIFWNRGAEEVLGRASVEVLGQPCFEVVKGRDLFGNRYCYKTCPTYAATRDGESVLGYELVVPRDSRTTQNLAVTVLQIPGSGPGLFTIVHLLQAVDPAARLARLLAELVAARPPAGNGGSALSPLLKTAETPPPLTVRECEILGLVASGLANKDVAARLGLRLSTVRNHIHRILDKLNVHSKLEAVSLAFRQGWVPSPGTLLVPGAVVPRA